MESCKKNTPKKQIIKENTLKCPYAPKKKSKNEYENSELYNTKSTKL